MGARHCHRPSRVSVTSWLLILTLTIATLWFVTWDYDVRGKVSSFGVDNRRSVTDVPEVTVSSRHLVTTKQTTVVQSSKSSALHTSRVAMETMPDHNFIKRMTTVQMKLKRKEEKVKLIILSYLRGGSSFFGGLFRYNPGAFYLFEPLDAIYGSVYGNLMRWYPHDVFFTREGLFRNVSAQEETKVIGHIQDLLDCRLDRVPTEVWANQFMVNSGPSLSRFLTCLLDENMAVCRQARTCAEYTENVCPHYHGKSPHPCGPIVRGEGQRLEVKVRYANYTTCLSKVKQKYVKPCIQEAKDICAKSKVRAIKVVRLSAGLLEKIMSRDPSIRVIHLTRDPRGVVMSRKEVHALSFVSRGKMKTESKSLCEIMRRNLKTIKNLSQHYSVHTVKYEDLALNPSDMSRSIYENFLKQQYPPEIAQFLNRATNGNVPRHLPYGILRNSSEETAYAWRKKMSDSVKRTIEAACMDVLKELDYKL